MRAKIVVILGAALAFLKTPWVRRAAQLLAFAACLWYILRHWDSLLVAARGLAVSPFAVLGSIFFCLLALAAGVFSWYFILKGLGSPLTLVQAALTHLRPVMSKYIPGYAWQYLGKGFLSNEAGVPNRIIALGFGLEFILVVWSGAGLGLLFLPPALNAALPVAGGIILGLGLIGLLLFSLAISPALLRFAAAHLPSQFSNNGLTFTINRPALFLAVLAIFVAWLAHGCAFWLTSAFYSPLQTATLLDYTAAYTLAFLAGWLIIFIPNGLGVREGVLALLLADKAPAAVILSAAVVFRFIQLGGDLVGYLLSLPLSRRKPHNNP